MHRLNLAARKKTERRAGLCFNHNHKKLSYPKRFTDNVKKKIKDDLFFYKTIGFGATVVSLFYFTEFFTGT